MSRHSPAGAVYTTQDLVRMAQMEYFGQYSAVVGRALVKLAALEAENKKLRERLAEIEALPAPQGNVIKSI
jgi:regulator of replication initiation timing